MAAQKVLILGSGFGGAKVALELADSKDFVVTLISDQPDFRFYPALYLAATGGNRASSSIPLKEIFDGKSVNIVDDFATQLDRDSKSVSCQSGKSYNYDILIVGLGSVTNYFGIRGLAKFAHGIKSVREAKRLRDHIHKQLLDDQKPDVNYVVVGGGPTGVELAGAMPAYIKHVMKNHGLADKKLNIHLVESAPRLLPQMPKAYSRAVGKRLRRLGVKIDLSQKVEAETVDSLTVGGQLIKSRSVIWTAGVASNPFLASNEFKLNDRGKVVVDEYLQSEPDVFVVGDNAATTYSGMAQTALHDARFVANNLKRKAHGKLLVAYRAVEPAYVTPVGPHWAAVKWRKMRFYGLLGWLVQRIANAIAYRDLESWAKVSSRWLAEDQLANDCPTCDSSRPKV